MGPRPPNHPKMLYVCGCPMAPVYYPKGTQRARQVSEEASDLQEHVFWKLSREPHRQHSRPREPPEGDNVSRTLQSKRTSKASKKSLTRTQRTKVHSKQHKGFQFSTSFPWGLHFMTPNCPNLECQGSTHPQSVVSLHRVAVPYKDPGEQRQTGIPHIYRHIYIYMYIYRHMYECA